MLTDDDLTRELGGAFRAETEGLRYAGRVPTPRTGPGLAGPLGTTAVAAAVLGAVWVAGGTTGSPAPPGAGPASTPSAPAPRTAPRMVTDTIEVAGFTFTYRHAAGEERVDDLYAMLDPGAVPADAEPIEAPEGVKAWAGTEPTSGDHAVWVEAPTRNGGRLFAVLSPTWSVEELTDLFYAGRPRPVPAV